MKKIFLGLFAVIMALSFVFAGQKHKSKLNPTLTYVAVVGGAIYNAEDKAAAEDHFGCKSTEVLCARAYALGHEGDPQFREPGEDIFQPE